MPCTASQTCAPSHRCIPGEFWCSNLKSPKCSCFGACLANVADCDRSPAGNGFTQSNGPLSVASIGGSDGLGSNAQAYVTPTASKIVPIINLVGNGTAGLLSNGGAVMVDSVPWQSR